MIYPEKYGLFSEALSSDRPQMIAAKELAELVNRHTGRVLTVAQMTLPPETFTGLRKIILDEFGRNGLLGEVARLERQDK